MKRRLVLSLVVGLLLISIGVVSAVLLPYVQGRKCTREIYLSSNVLDFHQKPPRPVLIQSELDVEKLLKAARSRLGDHDPIRDMYGLTAFAKSVQGFDFANEILVLIPFWQPADDDSGLKAPHLASRKLAIHIWIKPRHWWSTIQHLGLSLRCIGVAVRREHVDEVEVKVGRGQVEILVVN